MVFKLLVVSIEIYLLWWIFSVLINKDVLPSPIETLKSTYRIISDGSIIPHLIASLKRVVLGTFLGVLLAVPVGISLGYSKMMDVYLGATFDFLYTIPKVVFLPIIIVLLGIGDIPKIFLIALVLFFQQTVVIRDGVKRIPADLEKSIVIMGANNIQIIKNLIIPYCLPDIMTSLRSTLGTSVALLFITENFASVSGLGYFISTMMDQRNYVDMYAGILVLAIMGWILYYLIDFLEKKICKWKYLS